MAIHTYRIYRGGPDDLKGRIKTALADFRQSQGTDPAAIVVHASEAEAAQAMGLGIEVRGSGGCLVPEVWLEFPDQGGQAEGQPEQGELWEAK